MSNTEATDEVCIHLGFDEYQEQAYSTTVEASRNINYMTMGLCGEAGEVANKVKKIMRDSGGEISDEIRRDLRDEIGDVLWYVAGLCTEMGLSLEHVALCNLAKLADRKSNKTIHGSGDKR